MGLRGWQWLFIIEGIPSVLLGIVTWFYLTDRPDKADWLTAEQKAWLVGQACSGDRGQAGGAASDARAGAVVAKGDHA